MKSKEGSSQRGLVLNLDDEAERNVYRQDLDQNYMTFNLIPLSRNEEDISFFASRSFFLPSQLSVSPDSSSPPSDAAGLIIHPEHIMWPHLCPLLAAISFTGQFWFLFLVKSNSWVIFWLPVSMSAPFRKLAVVDFGIIDVESRVLKSHRRSESRSYTINIFIGKEPQKQATEKTQNSTLLFCFHAHGTSLGKCGTLERGGELKKEIPELWKL